MSAGRRKKVEPLFTEGFGCIGKDSANTFFGKIGIISLQCLRIPPRGQKIEDELGDLVFHDPEQQQWQTADAYLSGNVRAKLAAILNAGRRAGSSKNLQRWTFILVRDRSRLAQLAAVVLAEAHT